MEGSILETLRKKLELSIQELEKLVWKCSSWQLMTLSLPKRDCFARLKSPNTRTPPSIWN